MVGEPNTRKHKLTNKIKLTHEQLEKLKFWWKIFQQAENEYWQRVGDLERKISKHVGIKDIEIFHSDNTAVGIGNYDRTMPLIHREKLE